MNLILTIFFLITNSFRLIFSLDEFCSNTLLIDSRSRISQEYIPLRYLISKTFVITNPCNTQNSISIRNNTFYKFHREEHQWKRLCISRKIFNQQAIVNSISYSNNDLILIINGVLFRTQDIISSSKNPDIIYRFFRYFSKKNAPNNSLFIDLDVPIVSEKIDYVFTTPCCTCLQTTHSISNAFNDYIILANRDGFAILFYLKSMTMIYNFGNIFQFQSVSFERK
jgi:hypothetical protein